MEVLNTYSALFRLVVEAKRIRRFQDQNQHIDFSIRQLDWMRIFAGALDRYSAYCKLRLICTRKLADQHARLKLRLSVDVCFKGGSLGSYLGRR
jgi:hypothetical protein